GFGVVGFDIDPAKSARLKEFGAQPAASIADVVSAARVIVLAGFNTDQIEPVVEREIIPAIRQQREAPDKVVLCTSTCDPDRVAALAARIAGEPIKFLETPVSGTS